MSVNKFDLRYVDPIERSRLRRERDLYIKELYERGDGIRSIANTLNLGKRIIQRSIRRLRDNGELPPADPDEWRRKYNRHARAVKAARDSNAKKYCDYYVRTRKEHPDWSKTRIAKEYGIPRQTASSYLNLGLDRGWVTKTGGVIDMAAALIESAEINLGRRVNGNK